MTGTVPAMASGPERRDSVAVVVATHDRAELLVRLLDALRVQTRPPDEVVVVDDASSDATAAVLATAVTDGDLPIEVIRLDENGGPAVARNRGWRATRCEVVAFTDDDCRPRSDWLEHLAGAVAGADVAQGRVVPDRTQLDRGRPFTRTLDVGGSPFFETANIAYRRTVLEALDGFDERMRRGEDTDLGQRAVAAGLRVAAQPAAVVEHEVFPMDLRGALRNAGHAYWVVRVVRTHPGLRRFFWTRLLLLPHHRYTLPAVGGVAVSAASIAASGGRGRVTGVGLGLAAALPWVRFRLQPRPTVRGRVRRVLWLPGQLLVECAEVVAVLRARHGYAPRRDDHRR